MERIKSWLESVPELQGGFQLDESEAARGKFSICCQVKVEGKSFILKRSVVGEMDPRGGAKWVRDIRSLAAEFDFYEEYCKANTSPLSSIPNLIASFSNFDPEKDNPEDRFAQDGSDYKPRADLVFALLMEDLGAQGDKEYTQLTNGLSTEQLPEFVHCLAEFHSETSRVAAKLAREGGNTNIWSLGAFWTEDKRQDFNKEVAGIAGRWEAFYVMWANDILASVETDQFGIIKVLTKVLNVDEAKVVGIVKGFLPELGLELSKHCNAMSEVVKKEERVSIVHGDNKVANIFYSSESEKKFKWIDFQWAGFGSPTLDLVYIIAGSVQDVENLECKLEGFLTSYWKEFHKLVNSDSPKKDFDESFVNFKFGFLDYCRVVLGYMWDGKLTSQILQSREGGINFCLHNRSVKHVCWLTQKIVQYLIELQIVNVDQK